MSSPTEPSFQPPESWLTRIEAVWPCCRWVHVPTIVAVSGGPDSVALLRTLVWMRSRFLCLNRDRATKSPGKPSTDPGKLMVAHVNHGLRGSDSNADQKFVEDLASELNLLLETFRDATGTRTSEADLRRYRYECLQTAANQHGARYIVTGHTRDDQIETILFRIFRGTGLRGLTGIPSVRQLASAVTLVRPMLSIGKQEIEDVLTHGEIAFRTDDSNEQSQYTRNFLRNELLPKIRQRFPDVDGAIVRLGQHAIDLQPLFSRYRETIQSAVMIQDEAHMTIDCTSLQSCSTPILREMLIEVWDQIGWPRGEMNQAKWHELANLIHRPETLPNVINLPGNVRAERKAECVELVRKQPPIPENKS